MGTRAACVGRVSQGFGSLVRGGSWVVDDGAMMTGWHYCIEPRGWKVLSRLR